MNKRNPFTFGALALAGSFTDREEELRELLADMANGQDVVLYAPRRYGKSSLVLRAAKRATAAGSLVGYLDVMKTPTKEAFAAALARTIHSDLASPKEQAVDAAARLFRGLRVQPTMEVDPRDGSLRFLFQPTRRRTQIDDTIERLLELPAEIGADRGRQTVLVFDEFQEIVALDQHFPNLLRAVFQTQPEVGHVYLGSRRHVIERIFDDRNEPFWRSARRLEIGPIAPRRFATFLKRRFSGTDKEITDGALERLLALTGGHPYATQELAYFVWELVPTGHFAYARDVDAALEKVLRSEHNHFAKLWEDASRGQRLLMLALAAEPTSSIYGDDYHSRHELPPNPSLQTALRGLVHREIAGRNAAREHCIVEPFFADWLLHEQR
jgi:hypothetical protein